MSTTAQIILCTCPDQCSAENLAQQLIANHLAACVSIVPGLLSIYRWQGQIESAQEHLLLIKSNQASYQRLEAEIKRHHPYEVPEICAIPIISALPDYLHWIDSCLPSN
jgi:periplasmic divalent cation tolerance protein